MIDNHTKTVIGGSDWASAAAKVINDLRLFFLFAAVSGAVCFGQGPPEGGLPNCPIMTDNEATSEYFFDFEGKRYYFCCEACIEDFRSDPERFANQKGVTGFPLDDAIEDGPADEAPLPYYSEPEGWEWVIDRGFALFKWIGQTYHHWHLSLPLVKWHLLALIGFAGSGVVWLWRTWRRPARLRTAKTDSDPGSRSVVRRYGLLAGWLVGLIVLLESFLLTQRIALQSTTLAETRGDKLAVEGQLRGLQDIKLEEEVHFGTFITYGFPPRPRPPKGREPELTGTYYRGNDERLDNMYNGGQYLTVTFKTSMETESGKTIGFGDPIGSELIFMKVKFIRANQTSNGYFTSEYMTRMYLTMQWDRFLGRDRPVADRIDWKETDPRTVWEARFPLPKGDQFHADWKWLDDKKLDQDDARGVVYLCEERYRDDKLLGGRYHYGIEYQLIVTDGKVATNSGLFMGSTYLGRNFTKYQISNDQWLSTEPIPEQPN